MGGGGVVASTPSHPLVRRRVKMTKSVTASCVGVGSTRSVLQDWSVTSPTPYYIIWWLTFMVSTNLYKLYVFQNRSAFKYLHNQIITAWHSRKNRKRLSGGNESSNWYCYQVMRKSHDLSQPIKTSQLWFFSVSKVYQQSLSSVEKVKTG